MALWITQALHLPQKINIILAEDSVSITEDDSHGIYLCPRSRHEANLMSVALRMAGKRMEDIGKGLSNE